MLRERKEEWDFHEESVRRWCISLGIKKIRVHLHPTLSDKHRPDRIDFSLSEWIDDEDLDNLKWNETYNTVHIDEAWYYFGWAAGLLKYERTPMDQGPRLKRLGRKASDE